MKIRPSNDYVIIKRNKTEEKLASGLFVPANAQEKSVEGIVVAVGPGKILADGSRRKPEVEPGSTIIFGKWAGNEIEVDGEKHLFIREDDILAITSKPTA
jgi:chaperonin GroES